MWYEKDGKEKDVVVSTRVRLARNLVDYPFESRLDDASAKEIIGRIEKALTPGEGFEKVGYAALSPEEKMSYVERHLVSREFARKNSPHELFVHKNHEIYVMVCEEDHIRIQSILPGLDLDRAFEYACEADDLIDSHEKIAYSEKYGYLTHCPTNLGTGMRASVMMYLPALTMSRQIPNLQNQLSKVGLTIRGMSGEGSSSLGYLYQVSNQVTLGIGEEDTLRKLEDVVRQIIESERKLRNQDVKDRPVALKDRARRALGTMLYAELISSEEMISLYADARLGASLGLIDVDVAKLDELLFSLMPATLASGKKDSMKDGASRDQARAGAIREALKESAH